MASSHGIPQFNGTPAMAPSSTPVWHPAMAPQQWHPSMAPQQWHPAMATQQWHPTSTPPKLVASIQQWHPAMASHNSMAPQQWHPAALLYGTQQWHPSNGTQQRHPAMAPSNGTLQWHPSNGTQREPRQSWCPPSLLLEVRTPIAKAIWWKKIA